MVISRTDIDEGRIRLVEEDEELLPNVHPCKVLLDDFMAPLGLSQNALGRALGVPPRRINEIVHARRAITADTALRLARYFGTSERFWLGLQLDFDLEDERRRHGAAIVAEIVPRAA